VVGGLVCAVHTLLQVAGEERRRGEESGKGKMEQRENDSLGSRFVDRPQIQIQIVEKRHYLQTRRSSLAYI
jgi:hypothetical protein